MSKDIRFHRIEDYDKKIELGVEERTPIFSPGPRRSEDVISTGKVKVSSTSKTFDMSDYVASPPIHLKLHD